MTDTMPYAHLGEALATDYFLVREEFSDEQWDLFIRTRRFVDQEVLPVINDYWERAELPWPLITRLAELGLVGEDIEGYGCPGMTPLATTLMRAPMESPLLISAAMNASMSDTLSGSGQKKGFDSTTSQSRRCATIGPSCAR